MPIPERYRRLWRRRLRRRPLLPFLLLATVACCMTCSLAQIDNPKSDNPWLLALGGAIAMFGLTGVWIASRCRGMVYRVSFSCLWLLPICYALEDGMRVIGTMCLVIVLGASLLGGLVRALTASRDGGLRKVSKQVSVGYLLLLTTFVAISAVALQQVDQEVLAGLTADPNILWYLLAEVGTAPAFLLVSRVSRSTAIAATLMALIAIVCLVVVHAIYADAYPPGPALFMPPHYYHVGHFLTTALWVLGTRSQKPTDKVSDRSPSPASGEQTLKNPAKEPTSIDLRA